MPITLATDQDATSEVAFMAEGSEDRRTDWSQYANEITPFEKQYQSRLLALVHLVMKSRLCIDSDNFWFVHYNSDGFRFTHKLHDFNVVFPLQLAYPASQALQYDFVRLEELTAQI